MLLTRICNYIPDLPAKPSMAKWFKPFFPVKKQGHHEWHSFASSSSRNHHRVQSEQDSLSDIQLPFIGICPEALSKEQSDILSSFWRVIPRFSWCIFSSFFKIPVRSGVQALMGFFARILILLGRHEANNGNREPTRWRDALLKARISGARVVVTVTDVTDTGFLIRNAPDVLVSRSTSFKKVRAFPRRILY